MEVFFVVVKILVILTCWPLILIDKSIEATSQYEDRKLERCNEALEARPPGITTLPEACQK